MAADPLLWAFVIFILRVVNSAVGTMRMVVVARDRRLLASAMAFIEALMFAVVIANVVSDLGNLPNLMAYCGGFAVGNYVGMAIEARLVTSYVIVNIISMHGGHDIAVALRNSGHGATEIKGAGGSGDVIMLSSVVQRRDVPDVLKTVYSINPKAFVTMEEARTVLHGWIRALREQG